MSEITDMQNVSRETFADLQSWQNMLNHWNKRINLVSKNTTNNLWLRHWVDSWQLVEILPKRTKSVLDLGSGAGFPALALAIAAKHGKLDLDMVYLVEANGKKCNFLRAVIRELGLPALVLQKRVEGLEVDDFYVQDFNREALPNLITARAFAPLPKLFEYIWGLHAKGIIGTSAQMLLPKGASWQEEVEGVRKHFDFELKALDSQTDKNAKILHITNLQGKKGDDK